MADKETFTCYVCNKTYDKGWSDEEALAETKENFGDVPIEECDVVCDDCYQAFTKDFGKEQ